MINKIILVLIIILISYGAGRRVGKKQGIEEGLKQAPIYMRKDMLIQSKCPLCGVNIEENTHNNN